MTSWLNNWAIRCHRLLPVALIATTFVLFMATGMLYQTQSKQRELLAISIRTSGWVAYQAQLEYVKAHAALELGVEKPSQKLLDDLGLRMEILLSRLPILYASEEGKLLRDYQDFEPKIKGYEAALADHIDQLSALVPDSPQTSAILQGWDDALDPLGKELQTILQTSVAYNDEVYRREREFASNPANIPLGLMFASGAALVILLFVQSARDRHRLADVLAAREREAATEANLRAAVDAMPAVIVIVDPATKMISFINPAGATLVDPSPIHPDWARLVDAAMKASSDGANRNSIDIGFPRTDDSITSLRGATREVIWEGRPQMLLALADTTQNRAAELKVMQAAKLATLGEMATAIVHELNQPLAVIKMASANARRLIGSAAPADSVLSKLDRIESQIDRAKRITDQVRRYGRMPSHDAVAVPLRHAIELAAGFVSEQYRAAGIRLDLDFDLSPEIAVMGEQTMFEQVIVNLLVNARDAFEGADRTDSRSNVSVSVYTAGDEAVVAVTDNAGGISPEVFERLFEPFATTKGADKGTGLGLSLSRTVIRNMNGSITAANVADGACFAIRLPIASASAERRNVA